MNARAIFQRKSRKSMWNHYPQHNNIKFKSIPSGIPKRLMKQKIHFSFKSCYLLYLVFFHDSSSLINYKSWILLFHSVNLIIFFLKILIINGNFTKNKQTLTRKKMINCLRITITRKTRSGTNTYSQWWWW